MTDAERPRGPASCYPPIENTCGQRIAHWRAVLGAAGPLKHMTLVARFKGDHGLGHSHANALAAACLAWRQAV